ncbi:MAG: hypothetical protein A2219_02665 [Elusimicrobia bacterium RIFOXYA2_FULL_50_26]|nr:MAG: hypothetical protein A2219_02665 [Elusimicrobia bacterium RIFOXYA2_FULL_50_26]OGS25007.1 MAG: hypothetical protein A2314_01625 [Elusimicrobia bacterium RIFOXYB2_FULL_50_12]
MEKTILVVDDEEEIVSFLERFLQRMNLSSIKATSGREALRLYVEKKVDLVFLDIQLESRDGHDGLSVLRELRKQNSSAQVIMITGRIEQEYQDKARELGAIDYIVKPLDLGDLRQKINKYIPQ